MGSQKFRTKLKGNGVPLSNKPPLPLAGYPKGQPHESFYHDGDCPTRCFAEKYERMILQLIMS